MKLSDVQRDVLRIELGQALRDIMQNLETGLKIDVCHPTNTLIERLNGDQRMADCIQELSSVINRFCFFMTRIPSVWAFMFLDEHVHEPTRKADLGDFYFIFEIYFVQLGTQDCGNLFGQLLDTVKPDFLNLVSAVNKRFGEEFQQCKEIVKDYVDRLNTKFKKGYINKYMIFRLMKEVSQVCHSHLKDKYMAGIFQTAEQDLISRFIRFTIKKYQIITIQGLKPLVQRQYEDKKKSQEEVAEQLKSLYSKQLVSPMDISRNIIYGQAQRKKDSRVAVLVEVQDRDKMSKKHVKDQKYLVFVDLTHHVSIMNGAFINHKWLSALTENDLTNTKLRESQNLGKLGQEGGQIAQILTNAPSHVGQIGVGEVECIGESLGEVLAHFHQYDSIASFVADFATKTAVGGSLYFLVDEVPLLGALFQAGGFSIQLFHVLLSDYRTNREKVRGVQQILVKNTNVIAASVAGAVVGEFLIPIPVVGMFIGGVVAGYFAEVGWQKFIKKFNQKKYRKMKKAILGSINEDGSWDYNAQTLRVFGIKEKYFLESIPAHVRKHYKEPKKIWMTMLCFCILSHFVSKSDKEKMQNQKKAIGKDIIEFEEDQKKEYQSRQSALSLVKRFDDQNIEATKRQLRTRLKWFKPVHQISKDNLPRYADYHLDETLRYFDKQNVRFINDLQPALELMIKSLG